jgi:hypothetical protein
VSAAGKQHTSRATSLGKARNFQQITSDPQNSSHKKLQGMHSVQLDFVVYSSFGVLASDDGVD